MADPREALDPTGLHTAVLEPSSGLSAAAGLSTLTPAATGPHRVVLAPATGSDAATATSSSAQKGLARDDERSRVHAR